jgi:hypothetical protein
MDGGALTMRSEILLLKERKVFNYNLQGPQADCFTWSDS